MVPDEFIDFDYQEIKNYITKRLKNRVEVTKGLTVDLEVAVSRSVDAAEEFIGKMIEEQDGYSDDDVIEYIIQKTGLEQEFADLFLWYRTCYEMEHDMWEHIGEDCLDCGGGPLFSKEIVGEDYVSKIICQKCGNEMAEDIFLPELEESPLINSGDLDIVKDFDKFCNFIDSNNPPLTKKKKVLAKKDAFNLNSCLHFKREVAAPNYQQDQYYCLDLLFDLALASGLYRKVVNDSGKTTLQQAERMVDYQQLNDYEKFVFLLESFWCNYDFEKLFTGFSLHNGVYLTRNLLISIATSKPFERLEKSNEEHQQYIDNCFSFDFKIVIRFSCFGLCTFEWAEETKKIYSDVIKTIIPTEMGCIISNTLVTEGLPYFKHAELFSHLLDTSSDQQKPPNKRKPPFHKLIARLFPEGAVQNSVPEVSLKTTTCTYVFKVLLGKKIWRKIRISSGHTLEDLHLAIQDAFEFSNDHLYAFFLNEGNDSDPKVYCRESGEDPFSDEVVLNECNFYPGQQFSYLFDFGDMWKFNITLLELDETTPAPSVYEIIEYKGDAPEQYPLFD